jgi:hypothetical protein
VNEIVCAVLLLLDPAACWICVSLLASSHGNKGVRPRYFNFFDFRTYRFGGRGKGWSKE